MTTTHGRRGGVIVTAKITRAGMTTTSDCDAASHCNKILRRHAADARLQSHRERTQQPALCAENQKPCRAAPMHADQRRSRAPADMSE